MKEGSIGVAPRHRGSAACTPDIAPLLTVQTAQAAHLYLVLATFLSTSFKGTGQTLLFNPTLAQAWCLPLGAQPLTLQPLLAQSLPHSCCTPTWQLVATQPCSDAWHLPLSLQILCKPYAAYVTQQVWVGGWAAQIASPLYSAVDFQQRQGRVDLVSLLLLTPTHSVPWNAWQLG